MSQILTCQQALALYSTPKIVRMQKVGVLSDRGNDVSVSVPESAYQSTFVQRAHSIAQSAAANSAMAARNNILRGLEVKPDTNATLDALAPNDQSSESVRFADFLLQGVNEATEEKYQLVETFGEPIVFLFGTRPAIYQYSGTLLNTQDYSWRDGWKEKYALELRGTQLAKNKRRAYLTYDYVLREGYLLGMNIGQISANPNHTDFSFTMYITREVNLRPVKQNGNQRSATTASGSGSQASMSATQKLVAALKSRIGDALGLRGTEQAVSTTAIKGMGVDASAGQGGGFI